MSVFTLVGIVAAMPVGGLAGRVGAKRLMVGAAFLASLAALASAFANAAPMLLALRALEGLGLVAIIASGPLVMQRCVDPRCIGSATGIWMLGGMLGATLAGISRLRAVRGGGFSRALPRLCGPGGALGGGFAGGGEGAAGRCGGRSC